MIFYEDNESSVHCTKLWSDFFLLSLVSSESAQL